ncbi:hypothetical protein APHAL10511_006123 [Amanita phalloides]|nr:hypothetical protein APHAL10511_006123 [Amanita phalloides]
MPRFIGPSQDAQDDYVRQLLDQRTARADFHTRFSASDISDTPSVYSRSLFSPRPTDRGEPSSSPTEHYPPSHGHFPSAANATRERLHDPSASTVDFDLSDGSDHHASLQDEPEDLEADSMLSTSMLGPKMRFHSRAPWELEGTLEEEDETTPEAKARKSKTTAAKFFNFGPCSPRVSNVSRPSCESVRPEVVGKNSMDGSAGKGLFSRGTISMHKPWNVSTVSLGKASNGGCSDRVRPSLGPPSPASTLSSPYTLSPGPRISSDANSTRFNQASFDCGERRVSTYNSRIFFGSPTPSELQQSFHPYANPDLVASHTPEPNDSSDSLSTAQKITSSESTNTVTEFSTTSATSRSTVAATLTPDSSTASMDANTSAPRFHGREISTPVGRGLKRDKDSGDHHPRLTLGVQSLPGWTDKATTPSFGLIPLEEARAQRARSATQPPSTDRSSTSLDGDSGLERDAVSSAQSSSAVERTCSRARSASSGARAKGALQSFVGTQPRFEANPSAIVHATSVAGKTLKNKRSGFMRLLIGNRMQDRENRMPPPPVPTVPDTITSNGLQPSVSKSSRVHRVPVPRWIATQDDITEAQGKPANDDNHVLSTESAANSKRPRPPLSIGTESLHLPPTSAIKESPKLQTVLAHPSRHQYAWRTDNTSHSAPADVLNFPALQLRPISSLFGSHFGEHLSKQDSRPSLDTDTSTLLSPSCYSPTTPRSIGLYSDKVRSTSMETDDQSVVRALQDHLVSAKIAWEKQIWELEGHVRDLKAQVDDLKAAAREGHCETCGGKRLNDDSDQNQNKAGIVDRPRARTGNLTRFGSAIA